MSPFAFWTNIMRPLVWHYGCWHLRYLGVVLGRILLLDLTENPKCTVVATYQSKLSHVLKQTLLYYLLYSKWVQKIQPEHHAVLKKIWNQLFRL